jgi:hypothetical protein
VLRTEQYPGELILTLGATYHAGFSHGNIFIKYQDSIAAKQSMSHQLNGYLNSKEPRKSIVWTET